MITRFDIANKYKEYWHLLCWKGEEHTKGVYFDDKYGYMIDTGLAVRIKHDEAAPPVFYVPGNDDDVDDEVFTSYPYTDMRKVNRSFHPLFKADELDPEQFDDLFFIESDIQLSLQLPALIDFEHILPVKRDRDRSWIKVTISDGEAGALVLNRQKEEKIRKEIIEIYPFIGCNEGCRIQFYMNTNAFYHVISLLGNEGIANISVGRHKLKISNNSTNNNIEAVISMSKLIPEDIDIVPD